MHRFPNQLANGPGISVLKSGKSVLAHYKLLQTVPKMEGLLTENSVVFILKGTKVFHYPNQQLEVNSGELILLKRGTYFMSNYVTGNEGYSGLMLCMDDAFLKNFISKHTKATSIQASPDNYPLQVACTEEMRNVCNTIIKYMEQQHAQIDKLLALKLEELFLLLLGSNKRQEFLQFLLHLFDKSANAIEITLKNNLFKALTLQEYARLCGMSLSAFKREFARLYSMPPKEWINRERLSHAHYLIENTTKNINMVAEECGFENASYFIKVYKERFGHTPKNTTRAKIAIF